MRSHEQAAADAGFTLIEVIVSFIILAMVLGSVTLSLSYAARLHRMSDAKQSAITCAERVVAERLSRSPNLPQRESSADDEDCHWRIARRIARAAYTESARNLISFRLEILDSRGNPVDVFETYYVEALP